MTVDLNILFIRIGMNIFFEYIHVAVIYSSDIISQSVHFAIFNFNRIALSIKLVMNKI